jgi:predicted RNA-binding Zn ribbon-like protein
MVFEERDMAAQQAPGALRLVQDFVNTLDEEEQTDELSTVEGMRAWLAAQGLAEVAGEPVESDRQRAFEAREAIRTMLFANHDREDAPEALAALNRLAGEAPLVVRFSSPGEASLEPARAGIEAVLARLLAAIVMAMADGSWQRLKICRADTCHWAFYDGSRNRSGTWCSMAVCGNRTKVRAYQQRRRQQAST